MSDFINWHTLIEFLLGISLSAAAGFRVFIPLLVLSATAVIGHIHLPTETDWVETPEALVVFAIAALLEIIGYYIPWLDHVLDIVATPAAILAGTLVGASIAPDMNPIVQWTIALLVGGGMAGLTKWLMNFLRLGSTAASGGLTNPLVATLELIIAVVLSVLAVTVPLLAGFLVIGLLLLAIRQAWIVVRGWRSSSPQDSGL